MTDDELGKIDAKLQMVESILEGNRTKSNSFIFEWYAVDVKKLLEEIQKKK